MKLFIDTTKNNDIIVALERNGNILSKNKISAKFTQAEKLLPLIDKILKKKGIKLSEIKEVCVCNESGGLDTDYRTSFTALRIGIITANALGYALGVFVKGTRGNTLKKRGVRTINPIYSQEPNITLKKK